MNNLLAQTIAANSALEVAETIRNPMTEKEKQEKESLQLFQLAGITDLVRSQIQFVSTDIRKMQTLRRFDQEYKQDKQWLKDLKRSYVQFLNTLLLFINKNKSLPFEPMQKLRELMDSNTLDVNVKYFGK